MLAIVFLASLFILAALKLVLGSFLGLDVLPWAKYAYIMVSGAGVATASAFIMARHAVNKLTLDTNPHAVALVLKAVNHITGNLMNQIQFVKQEIDNDGGLSETASTQITDAIEEAQAGLVVLNRVQDTADENAYLDIYPK